ncbi:MAG: hypothetical protein CL779_03120 [Chloroflexi bacterium]|nr:hypothetical protein [Chloroflexota bacterium]|tara:strand:- start:3659 stop:3967 length:309 start_codon:yes stop_codon:yes gene_type:complete
MNNLKIITFNPPNPKEGAYINYRTVHFVTLYNSILDTYGIFKVDKDWSDVYWTPPCSYIHPVIDWENIWKEMDYCNMGYIREYIYSETINGPEIFFSSRSRL